MLLYESFVYNEKLQQDIDSEGKDGCMPRCLGGAMDVRILKKPAAEIASSALNLPWCATAVVLDEQGLSFASR
ncbi:hypothetical protein N805_15595 [Pseudomonas putida S13.1.2]|uniref:Uncharacterized protein n=1 Tax=Pseudomonas putida S13.1.2 TaxID=1384061 RepID=A0AAU8SJF2_PSEPU|nr:hypothetical protein N805_15595 [Pseudomonas putida S13.1.2]